MRLFHFVLLVVLVSISSVSCVNRSTDPQVRFADSIGIAANSALVVLTEAYRQEGYRAIDTAQSEAEARAALARIEERWRPVWDAWAFLRATQSVYATAVTDGVGSPSILIELKDAYCALQAVWPETVPAMPIAMVSCPEESKR